MSEIFYRILLGDSLLIESGRHRNITIGFPTRLTCIMKSNSVRDTEKIITFFFQSSVQLFDSMIDRFVQFAHLFLTNAFVGLIVFVSFLSTVRRC